MPSKSIAQQRLMQAAEHGANFYKARQVRASMSPSQMHDFAVGSEKGKPVHVARASVKPARGGSPVPKVRVSTSYPHSNLGGYLHPKKMR